MSIVIHGVPPSPYVRKVRVILAEKGIPYETKMQPPFAQPPEYFKISPLGKIPCLQDGDFTLPDSSVIASYLERRHPEPALLPDDLEDYGRTLWFDEYADTKLASICTVPFFQRVVKPKFLNQEPDEELIAKTLSDDMPTVFDYLEGQLGDNEFMVGPHFSLADISIATQFANFEHGREQVDASRWPKLAAYVKRIHARPSFKACIEQDRALLA